MPFDPTTAKPLGGFDPTTANPAAAPEQSNADTGGLYAAIHGLEDTATFGQGDKLAAGMATLLRPAANAIGLSSGKSLSYSEALADIKARSRDSANAHPIAALTGDAAGLVGGGGVLSAVLKGAKALPVLGRVAEGADSLLAARAGQPVLNVARASATGGAVGALDTAGHGGNEDQILEGAAGGAVLGPIAGKLGSVAVKALRPAAQKAFALLADRIGEKPAMLQAAFNNFQSAVGRPPTMLELMGLKSQGELQSVAAGNPTVAEAMGNLRDNPSMAGDTPASLVKERAANMDAAMGPIRDQQVPIDASHIKLLMDDDAYGALRKASPLRKKLLDAHDFLRDNPGQQFDGLTVDDFDNLRQAMRGRQSTYANPANPGHNPHSAAEIGDMMDAVTGIAGQQVPAYGAALDNFRADSRYIDGFTHGSSGAQMTDAANPKLIAALGTREGQLGFDSGSQVFQGQRAVARTSPGGPSSAMDAQGISHAAHGIGALAAHSPFGAAYHALRSFGGKVKLSDQVSQIVAKYLTDPTMTQQGINILRKAGASNTDIRRLGTMISGATGAAIGAAVTGN